MRGVKIVISIEIKGKLSKKKKGGTTRGPICLKERKHVLFFLGVCNKRLCLGGWIFLSFFLFSEGGKGASYTGHKCRFVKCEKG